MSKFATKPIKAIKGRQQFEELVILNKDTDTTKIDLETVPGVWEAYEESLEAKYRSQFYSIVAYMELVSNLQALPASKFKDITPAGDKIKEFEFKYQDLRVYAIKIPNGKLIVLGGYKNRQAHDIKKFRSLKKQYLEQVNI